MAYAATTDGRRAIIWRNGPTPRDQAFPFIGDGILELQVGEETWNCFVDADEEPDYWPAHALALAIEYPAATAVRQEKTMKATLQGRIEKAERAEEGQVMLTFSLRGKVDGTGPTGREITGDVVVRLSARYADALKFGDRVTFIVDTETPEVRE